MTCSKWPQIRSIHRNQRHFRIQEKKIRNHIFYVFSKWNCKQSLDLIDHFKNTHQSNEILKSHGMKTISSEALFCQRPMSITLFKQQAKQKVNIRWVSYNFSNVCCSLDYLAYHLQLNKPRKRIHIFLQMKDAAIFWLPKPGASLSTATSKQSRIQFSMQSSFHRFCLCFYQYISLLQCPHGWSSSYAKINLGCPSNFSY